MYMDSRGVVDAADFLFLNLSHDTPNYHKLAYVFGCIEYIKLDETLLRLRPQGLVDGLSKWFTHCQCPNDFLSDYTLQRALTTVYAHTTVAEVQAARLANLAFPYPRICLIWLDGLMGEQPTSTELGTPGWRFTAVGGFGIAMRWPCYMLTAGLGMSYGMV